MDTMRDKLVMITGASSGIGHETARQLAQQGAEILMVSRDPERGRGAQASVATAATGKPPVLLLADLSSQASIRRLAEQVRSHSSRIDVLINNAGAVFSRRELTVDGIERTFALNHLASFLVTQLLFETLRAAPAGRIINMSSEIHSGAIDFDNLQGEKRYNFLQAYYQTKLENILFTYELARRIAGTGVTANALSPGPTRTRFGDNLQGLPRLFPLFMKNIPLLFAPTQVGARTPVYLASSPDVEGVSGKFFFRGREARTKPFSYDADIARRLWEVSAELTSAAAGRMEPAYPSPIREQEIAR